jgi:hypothetical protein
MRTIQGGVDGIHRGINPSENHAKRDGFLPAIPRDSGKLEILTHGRGITSELWGGKNSLPVDLEFNCIAEKRWQ